MKMRKTTLKKSTKNQSQKSELINDKKKIITASILISIAAIIYTAIVFIHFKFGLHSCGSIGFEAGLFFGEVISLLRMTPPFLMCVCAGVCILKIKNRSIRYILGILNIILIATPIIVVITSTAQTFNYLSEISLTDFFYCW